MFISRARHSKRISRMRENNKGAYRMVSDTELFRQIGYKPEEVKRGN